MKRIGKRSGLLLLLFFCFGWAAALAADVSYRDDRDVNEASSDDTMAYRIYVGKSIREIDSEFAQREGWEARPHDRAARTYRRIGGDYMEIVYLYAEPYNQDVVGAYRVSFFMKTKAAADDIFFNTMKNISYILGRPSIRRGDVSAEWFLNDRLKLTVDYTEYDTRLPVAKEYPFEIAIRRTGGDYKKFFQPSQSTN